MTGFRHLGDETIASLYRIDVVKATFEDPDGGTFEPLFVETHAPRRGIRRNGRRSVICAERDGFHREGRPRNLGLMPVRA